MNVQFFGSDHIIQRLPEDLRRRLIRAQGNMVEQAYANAGLLCEQALHDTRIAIKLPKSLYAIGVREFSDHPFKDLMGFFSNLQHHQGVPAQAIPLNSENISERVQLLTAFDDPDAVVQDIIAKVEEIVTGRPRKAKGFSSVRRANEEEKPGKKGFPRTAADIMVGKNPGDVLDPYILAATQILMFGGEFEPAIEATVAHKALMMVEGMLGHLHEDVIGAMRGNVRVPEPRGEDQETLDPVNNPFPGADVVQPPKALGQGMRFHQLKSKTGSAKGGDGRRLGEQLVRLQQTYGGDIFYHALIGNTLRGHRSKAGVEKAADTVVVLVGNASFHELTGSTVGPQLLLRLYHTAFREVSRKTGYRIDLMASEIVATFKERAEAEGEGMLEAILADATRGPVEEQDSRLFNRMMNENGRRRRGPLID